MGLRLSFSAWSPRGAVCFRKGRADRGAMRLAAAASRAISPLPGAYYPVETSHGRADGYDCIYCPTLQYQSQRCRKLFTTRCNPLHADMLAVRLECASAILKGACPSGVRPRERTGSRGGFDGGAGVAVLETGRG